MLQSFVIGYLGADAEVKGENGKEFTTFRVAHSERWKGADGVEHDTTQWVDVILNGKHNVVEYLKAGTLVYAAGHCKLRCYSSEKARGFIAGVTISAVTIELLGGQSDLVPKKLYSTDGKMHDIFKYYYCQDTRGEVLTNGRGKEYAVDDNGWVLPLEQAQAQVAAQEMAEQAQQAGQTLQAEQTQQAQKSTSRGEKK